MNAVIKTNIEKTIKEFEGGYSNHPNDKGGETYMGITRKFHPKEFDYIMSLAIEDRLEYATTFYYENYYKAYALLPHRLSYMLFDMAVNHGHKHACFIAQRALQILDIDIKPDGLYGYQTQSKLAENDNDNLILAIKISRAAFFGSLRSKDFILGWLRRAYNV